MIGRHTLQVDIVSDETAHRLAAFADRAPLAYNDFASVAQMLPTEPRVWSASSVGDVLAAAIDDGLTMSVAGEVDALRCLAAEIPNVDHRLMISGRAGEVEAFVENIAAPRHPRQEFLMALSHDELVGEVEPLPLQVAGYGDVPLLAEVRARALEEEYGIHVPRSSRLFQDLLDSVQRAVAMEGVAIWIEDGLVAFTAQLIAKTPEAATFGDLYTDPLLRGAGRATRALTAFCFWLLSESRHVTLRVGSQNEPALRLYDRVGFTVIDDFVSSLADAPIATQFTQARGF